MTGSSPGAVPNYIVFAALMISTALGLQSLWGLLFLYWAVSNVSSGRTLLLSEVRRSDDPILFWLILIAWVALGLMLIAADFFPDWN